MSVIVAMRLQLSHVGFKQPGGQRDSGNNCEFQELQHPGGGSLVSWLRTQARVPAVGGAETWPNHLTFLCFDFICRMEVAVMAPACVLCCHWR